LGIVLTNMWYLASCKNCGWTPGGFDTSSQADSYMLGIVKTCPNCKTIFRGSGHQRWDYEVNLMDRPPASPSTPGGSSPQAPPAVLVDLDTRTKHTMSKMGPVGALVLEDLEELNAVSAAGWPNATVALWGKVLDGAIKLRGLSENWWRDTWDKLTLGEVLKEGSDPAREIELRVPKALVGRLRDKTRYLRNAGTHQKYTRISASEANGAVEALSEFLSAWF
jgi:hypothetical protein